MTPAMPVLRGIAMHAQPHALVRPGRASAPSPKVSASMPVAGPAEIAAQHSAAIEAAFAAGRAEGFAGGRTEAHQELQDAADEALTRAANEGRLAGLQQGLQEAELEASRARQEAIEQIEQAAQQRIQKLDALLQAAATGATQWLAEMEDDLIVLTHQVVCRVFGAHAVDTVVLQAMVKHLLAQHGQRAQLAVHVHPDDHEALMGASGAGGSEAVWSWVADNTVEVGGVILRSPEGSLDARLETQMAALRDALLVRRRERKTVKAGAVS